MITSAQRLRAAAVAACLATFGPHPLSAQGTAAPAAFPVVEALRTLGPLAEQSAPVHGLVLHRDAATFTLQEGRLWLLRPVNGRTIGAVYVGTGTFHMTPPTAVERARTRLFLRADSVDAPIRAVAFLFSDGTLAELRRNLQFGDVPPDGDGTGLLSTALDFLQHENDNTWDPDLLATALNGTENGFFSAFIDRAEGADLEFMIQPEAEEEVSLSIPAGSRMADRELEPINSFVAANRVANAARPGAHATAYTIHSSLPQTADGGVSFSAVAEVKIETDTATGPWIPAELYWELDVDSVSVDGSPAPYFRHGNSTILWFRLPSPLVPGAPRTLRIAYHGKLIERYGDVFFIKSSISWYPLFGEGNDHASFDLTFRTPYGYQFASIGERTDSTLDGRIVVTHWSHPGPMRNASFNLGLFDVSQSTPEGVPPISVLYSDKLHRQISQATGELRLRDAKGTITQEVANAMRFYTHVFGPPPEPRMVATEIPWLHGEAWPGLIGLSFVTFHETAADGEDEVFRAHEVAHQWWSIGVDFATARDQWLSEGFANFSGLWYLQTSRGDIKPYLGMLRQWRTDLRVPERQRPPVSLGLRGNTYRDGNDGTTAVYEKGAWVLHMLRILMLQMSTMNEDHFTEGMREFYTTYRGGRATTEEFRAIMEKHAGADLKWFFDEWVDGIDIPTYTWAWRAEPAAGGQFAAHFRVRQTDVPVAFQMWVPVVVVLKDGRALKTRIHVVGPLTDVALPVPGEIKEVRFNELEGVLADVKTEGW